MKEHLKSVTESDSKHRHLEKMSIANIVSNINQEDHSVPQAIAKVLPSIERLIEVVVEKMSAGGRLFYIGAGTSGRLGILDASECPPTFGVDHGRVIGLIAGGDQAIRKAVEFAEDDETQAIRDLKKYNISEKDVVVGIAASGRTPYVIGGLRDCQQLGIITGSISCNPGSALAEVADYPIEAIVGPEFLTGSTRMKAGTAQKLILNMITTATFIKLGHVQDNKMVDMQLSNEKLKDRGTRLIMEKTNLDYAAALNLLMEYGSVRAALNSLKNE